MVRTSAECSVVCEDHLVPDAVPAQRGYVAFEVEGPIPFSEVGVLAGLTPSLAAAGISVFVVSTWDTDYILVQEGAADAATVVWRGAGYGVTGA